MPGQIDARELDPILLTIPLQLLAYDVDVSWWVTPDAYDRGYYEKVYRALQHWLAAEFPFGEAFYSNAEVP